MSTINKFMDELPNVGLTTEPLTPGLYATPLQVAAFQISERLGRFAPQSMSFKKTKQGVRALLQSSNGIVIAHTYL